MQRIKIGESFTIAAAYEIRLTQSKRAALEWFTTNYKQVAKCQTTK